MTVDNLCTITTPNLPIAGDPAIQVWPSTLFGGRPTDVTVTPRNPSNKVVYIDPGEQIATLLFRHADMVLRV